MIRFASAASFASVASVLVAAAASAWAAPAHADTPPPPAAYTLDVEIVEHGAPGTTNEEVDVSLAVVERGCVEGQLDRDDRHYEVKVCSGAGDGAWSFEIRRVSSQGKRTSVQRFRVDARLQPGKKALLGRVSHSGGAGTEVNAMVTPR